MPLNKNSFCVNYTFILPHSSIFPAAFQPNLHLTSSPAICMCIHKTPFHYITIYQFNSFTSRKQPISDEKPIVTFDYRTAGMNPLSTGTRSSLILGKSYNR
ncbi:hypothetical protein CEXT_311391 [Caerostris extrusa]|uniref:Uncharacterized protein n=1 Tax=Caerostris extrusa TaxID=172846 RepID=A0AAV4N2W9_CAEEX|nr:hypothetical protein CEXT_311391 [Caerostris extrusa]